MDIRRPRSVACWLAWAVMAATFVGAGAAAAQPPPSSPFEAALTAPELPSELPDGPPGLSNAELLERLQRAEARLQELEAAHAEHASIVTTLRERWSQVRDPSIETVEQQTHGSGATERRASKWYDRLSLRGYAQFRYNETVFEDLGSAPPQHAADRSVGHNQQFLIRRARLIFSGDVSDHLYVYMQPEFAATVPGSPDANHFVQIRDWYGDLYIDEGKVYRVRIGESKVPYGWENMQSSSNRLPLDRSDPLNSAARNERDLGLFFYYTPTEAQDLFREVLELGLKGSGNYGVFGIGVYNGQGGSFSEQNDNLHAVVRLTHPFQLANSQIVEMSVQAYSGKYTVLSAPIAPLGVDPPARPLGTLETGDHAGHRDERVAGTFVWYPQPFGVQVEWNVGRGPALNDAQTEVIERPLYGGYAMVMYRHVTDRCGTLFPFLRFNQYRGGYKGERNAPFSRIDEWEFGVEWQFNPQMELVTQYTITDRTNTVAQPAGPSYGQFDGHLVRAQFQINY